MSESPAWSLETTLEDILHSSHYSWRQLQQLLIKATLRKYRGNKTHAARALGISVRTLRNKCNHLEKAGIYFDA